MTRLGPVLFSLMIAMPAMAAPEAPAPADGSASERDAPRAPRLKFKSRGPVCLCGNGLSEKDIEQAGRAQPRSTDPHPTRSDK